METFGNAYSEACTLYGLNMSRDEFDEISIVALRKIGNKITRLHRVIMKTDDCNRIELPCNCNSIEAITYALRGEEFDKVTNLDDFGDWSSKLTEDYIEMLRRDANELYVRGGFVKYEQVGDYLYFKHPCVVIILYKGTELDEDGLPYITEKESSALAAFAIYSERYKKLLELSGSFSKEQATLISELKNNWLTAMSAARVSERINQNEMNEVLDILHSYNYKVYNRSFKPVR